ncbi:MAG: glycosyltransferase [candidate division Zixibacteria bacterium]|nr:glycosyltransferase [Candidatus Tariuqbacter arcticus]
MIPAIMAFLLILGAALYAFFTMWIYNGLGGLKGSDPQSEENLPEVTVIVPARNEDHNLEETLESLAAQDYPPEKFQVVMVDDRSSDQTPGIIVRFTKKYDNFLRVEIENLTPKISPKKNAIEWGIAASTGKIILTTDADCVHSPKWIRSMVSCFKPDTGMVAGLTLFEPEDESFFHKLHSLDYISHSFVGAGAIGKSSALNCTGANLAYRYEAYMELEGFGNKADMVSGDDEFLLQRMVNSRKWKAAFALGEDSIVRSLPPETVKGIIDQRLRWGSKGLFYPSKIIRLAIGIFIFLLILMLSPVLIFTELLPFWVFILAILLKLCADLMVMKRGFRIFDLEFHYLRFLSLFVIHPLIIVLSAVGGHFFPFNWKGQRFRSKV